MTDYIVLRLVERDLWQPRGTYTAYTNANAITLAIADHGEEEDLTTYVAIPTSHFTPIDGKTWPQ